MRIGCKFDDFLKEEGKFETTTADAIKKVLTFQIEEKMQAQRLTKTAMAQRMHTSLTLTTWASAAAALGKRANLELVAT